MKNNTTKEDEVINKEINRVAEIEFSFIGNINSGTTMKYGQIPGLNAEIHRVITKAREEERKEIIKLVKKKKGREYGFDNEFFPECRGYNKALQDIINSITNKEK